MTARPDASLRDRMRWWRRHRCSYCWRSASGFSWMGPRKWASCRRHTDRMMADHLSAIVARRDHSR